MEVDAQPSVNFVEQNGDVSSDEAEPNVNFVEQNGDVSSDEADTNNNTSGEGDGMNGGPTSALDGRITRKAKRRLRKSPSKELPPVVLNGLVTVPQKEKNMRKSRAGRGRGLPKKGKAKFSLFVLFWGVITLDILCALGTLAKDQFKYYCFR